MNSQTKIVVIPMKELIIGAIIAVIILVVAAFAVFSLGGENSQGTSGSPSSSYSSGKSTNPSASKTSASAADNANANSANIADTYTPGVYTSSLSLNGNPVDIQVTVDKNNINSIEMVNISDSVTTMYPMIKTSFDEIASSIIAGQSTTNVSYSADNKYTSTMLLNAIQNALDKCTI